MIKEVKIKFIINDEGDLGYDKLFYIELINDDDDHFVETKEMSEELNLTCENYIIRLIESGAIYPDNGYEGFYFEDEADCKRFVDTLNLDLLEEDSDNSDDIFSCKYYGDCCEYCHYIKIDNLIDDNDIIDLLKISKERL